MVSEASFPLDISTAQFRKKTNIENRLMLLPVTLLRFLRILRPDLLLQQVSHNPRSRRTTLLRPLPMVQAQLSHNHNHLPRLLPRLLSLHNPRNLRLHHPNLHHPNCSHQNLRRRLHVHSRKIHPFKRWPRRAILPRQRHAPFRRRSDMVIRCFPDSHGSTQWASPRLVGRVLREHRTFVLLRQLSSRHLRRAEHHRPAATLRDRYHRVCNSQRRRSYKPW